MNDKKDPEALKRQLSELEAQLESIKAELKASENPAPQAKPEPSLARAVPPALPSQKPSSSSPVEAKPQVAQSVPKGAPIVRKPWRPEVWIGRLGIGLLILGVLFLFQFAIEQGWLVPWVRVTFGIILGGLLCGTGWKMRNGPAWFSHMLYGGGLAIWYACAYAADRMYNLVPGPIALGAIVLLAISTYMLAYRERSQSLSVLATIGGLLSPLILLAADQLTLFELVSVVLVATAAMMVYFRRGNTWQPLLVFILGGLVFAEAGEGNSVLGQLGRQVVWTWWSAILVFIPLLRVYVSKLGKEKTTKLLPVWVPENSDKAATEGQVALASMSLVPLTLFVATSAVWNIPKFQAGWMALLFSLVAFIGWNRGGALIRSIVGMRQVLMFHTALFATGAMVMILDGSLQFVVMAAVGWFLVQMGIRREAAWLRGLGNVLLTGVTFWLIFRLFEGFETYLGGLGINAWLDLAVIGLLLSQAFFPWRRWEAYTYWPVGMMSLMAWFVVFFNEHPDTGPLITFSWAGVSAALLTVGLKMGRMLLSRTAIVLLVIVLFKLFIVDLASVAAEWRVALFMVLGIGFVALSYFISRWKKEGDDDESSDDENQTTEESSKLVAPPLLKKKDS